MAKEYIERETALKAIYTSTAAALEVKAIPAADVVEVVRCRDCTYGHTDRAGNIGCFHYKRYQTLAASIKPDDYCSYGKPKGEDDAG